MNFHGCTLPETNSKRTWKWMVEILVFFWVPAYFQGRTVCFRECRFLGKVWVRWVRILFLAGFFAQILPGIFWEGLGWVGVENDGFLCSQRFFRTKILIWFSGSSNRSTRIPQLPMLDSRVGGFLNNPSMSGVIIGHRAPNNALFSGNPSKAPYTLASSLDVPQNWSHIEI